MLEFDLNEKSIIVFCPSFFGYDIDIKEALEKSGAKVSLFDERVFKSVFGKALIRFGFHWLIRFFVEKYYFSNLIVNVKEVDFLLLVNPETIPVKVLNEAKKLNPKMRIITYMWDSFENKPQSKKYIEPSSSFFTFDYSDSEDYGIYFLPLFFVDDFNDLNTKLAKYDLSFIGTAHSQRYNTVLDIVKYARSRFLFFYCPSVFVFLYKKLFKGELKGLKLNNVSFSSMHRFEIISLIEETNTIVDISHPCQIGLTMRTIEMLGAGKKLITTNSQVLSYDFYHPDNILYYNGTLTLDVLNDFLKVPYRPVPNEIKYKYSIHSWVKRVFL
ncbi:hypothetical protein [Vibrio cyclitrophicus]|uniref:hypothetical protein n=1 Tax=Vibrio cyclitrophicus TaxID=47951 RepID=UPI000C81DED3|nr:hypothetical protein [Vibrio cyclitrophicus]PMH74634.1 hypothetical protein BCU59_02380 [Vibrio cyclitrophicus]